MILKPRLFRKPNLKHPLIPEVGFWLFNQGAGNKVFDLSGNSNTGTLQADTYFAPGLFGPCLTFDGTGDYVKVPYNISLYPGPPFSVSFWAKSDKTNYTSNAYVVSMYDYADDNRVWAVRISESSDNWAIVTSSDGTSGKVLVDDSNLSVDLNWHYFVFIYNGGGDWDMYVDGLKYDDLTSSIISNQESFMTFGGLEGAGYFDGLIDHVMIYNRVLSAAEILQLYMTPFCMFERDSIKLWIAATSGILLPPEVNTMMFGCNF